MYLANTVYLIASSLPRGYDCLITPPYTHTASSNPTAYTVHRMFSSYSVINWFKQAYRFHKLEFWSNLIPHILYTHFGKFWKIALLKSQNPPTSSSQVTIQLSMVTDFTKFDSSYHDLYIGTSVLYQYVHEGVSCTRSKVLVCIYLVFLITGQVSHRH